MEIKHLVKDRENGCPLGQKCDACNWYKPLHRHKSDGTIVQEWDCNINNLAVLQDETKARVFGVHQSIESSRNETVDRQDKLLNIVEAQHAALPRQ